MVSLFSFNSNWLYSFEKRKSKLKKFETTQSDYVETIFMSQKGKYVGGEFKGVKYIHLPYQVKHSNF